MGFKNETEDDLIKNLKMFIGMVFVIFLIGISIKDYFDNRKFESKKEVYLDDIKSLNSDNVVSIKFYGAYEITNRSNINNLIFSLKRSIVADKYYSSGKTVFDCEMKIFFKDKSYLLLKLRDYDVASDKLYIFIEEWEGKNLDRYVIANLSIGNNELKSVLKELNLPNWKNKDK